MTGTFAARTRELEDLVGHGKLVGSVIVDQVYALPIHSGYWRTGPLAGVTNRPRHGGKPHFLSDPLVTHTRRYLENLADAVLTGFLVQAMAENMEHLCDQVHDQAPRLFDDLRDSGHPIVTDDHKTAYDRPPKRPRLTRAALDEKARRVRLGEGHTPAGPTLPFRG